MWRTKDFRLVIHDEVSGRERRESRPDEPIQWFISLHAHRLGPLFVHIRFIVCVDHSRVGPLIAPVGDSKVEL